MPARARLALAVLVALAAVVVLVAVLRGGDAAGKGETVRGMPEAGFPLRGSLAGDRKAIDGAVAEWRDSAQPDPDDEAARDDPYTGRDADTVIYGRSANGDVVAALPAP